MSFTYDLLVIGSGTSAQTFLDGLTSKNRKIAIVDSAPYGGTCALRGCQPKKFFVVAAELLAQARHMKEIGIPGAPVADWKALQKAKSAFVDPIPERTEKGLARSGIDTLHGTARFVSPGEIDIDGKIVRAETVVIAAGARPRPLGFPGAELIGSSDDFLDLPELPASMAFVGGGYISTEFACVASELGCRVTILQRGDHLLSAFETELTEPLTKAMREAGIHIETNYDVCSAEQDGSQVTLHGAEGCEKQFSADRVFHGAGRVPNVETLDLDKAGIEVTRRGIVVDPHLRTTNENVYAIGDVASTPYQLATTGDYEGRILARNFETGQVQATDFATVPSVVFSTPPLAAVGMTEAAAGQAGKSFRVNRGNLAKFANSKRIGQRHAAYIVLIEENTDHILGAHLLGHNAGEIINVFALAMRHDVPAPELAELPWAYPTYSSDLKYMVT